MRINQFKLALSISLFCYFLPAVSTASSSYKFYPPPLLTQSDASLKDKAKKPSIKKYKEDELLVKFRAGVSTADKKNLHNEYGSKKIKEIKKLGIDHIKLKKGLSVEEAIKQYKKDPSVEYAEPNYIVTAHVVPNDPYYSSYGSWGQSYDDMWGLNKIDAQNAWEVTQGSSDIIVAVSDTGLDFGHPDIQGKIWVNTGEIPANGIDDDGNGYIDDVNGWNFVYDSPSPVDDHGHGTHVSGTIAAATNNGQGISGISWLSKIMPVKFLGAGGWGEIADGADSIIYAADNGAKVINCSWGGTGYSQTLEDAINYAYNNGIVVVVSAGNDWELAEFFHPAGAENVLTVAATDYLDNKALFSNSGDAVEVAAPGVDILSLRADGTDMRGDGSHTVGIDYLRADGTSMAAPHVSGLAALLFARNPSWSNRQVMGQIIGTTDDIGLPDIGTGRINAYSALTETALTTHIRYLDHTVDDSSGNNDGVIDANETITMIVDFRNLAAPVNGVTATLSTQDPYVTISDGTSEIGSMATWSKADNSTDPFVFFASSQFPSHHKIVFTLDITADNGNYSISKVIEETGSLYLPGWPVVTHGRAEAHAALADIDNDGLEEVVIVTDKLYVLNGDGTTVPGWPQEIDSLDWGDSPAVGDLDGDGSMEIVLSGVNEIYAWRADGTDMPGFPLIYGISEFFTDVSLADLDLDGDLEIISKARSYEGGSRVGKLYVWHHDGSLVSGWPNTLASGGYLVFPHKAIGNIDNDDYPEIIVPDDHQLYAWNHDGSLVSGWPVTLSYPGYIALGDIDNDGISEIFVGAAQGHIEVNGLYGTGDVIPGWPQDGTVPSIGDVDGDGFAEIVALQIDMVNGHEVVVYRNDGTIIPSNTRRTTLSNLWTAPTLGDIDGDGTVDIAIRTFAHKIYAWHLDGTLLPDFPIDVGWPGTGDPSDSAATFGDINGDGIVDLVTGSGFDTNVYAFNLPGAYDAGNLLWPMDNHDSLRSANADKLILVSAQLPQGTGGEPYNHMLTSTGGIEPLAWNIASGSLPPGLNLDTGTGEIFGIPSATGTYSFVVRVYDSASDSDIKTFFITVSCNALAILSTSLPNEIVGSNYSFTLAAVCGIPPYTWSLIEGNLPPGLNLNASTGEISGTPTNEGDYSFTVEVADSDGSSAAKSLGIKIDQYWNLALSVVGNGTATSNPAGIDCPDDCDESYLADTPVILTAIPDADSVFDGWSGGGCSSTGDCTVTMTADTIVTATFTQLPPPVADFYGTPVSGGVPLIVSFTDVSANGPTSWSWDFGDAQTSTDQHPLHVYETPGVYDVSLTVSNPVDADNMTKIDYITATACSYLPVKTGGAYYATLREAYTAAVDDALIESQAVVFNEDLLLDLDKSVSLAGGKDCSYTPGGPFATTVLNGKLTIRNGVLIVENMVIKTNP